MTKRSQTDQPTWDSDEACRRCGGENNDGEGYDGLCGVCADRAEAASEASVPEVATPAPKSPAPGRSRLQGRHGDRRQQPL